MTNTSSIIMAATQKGPARLYALRPLQWWRSARPKTLHEAALGQLREALAATVLPGNPDWCAAASGDAAKAIRVAVLTATWLDPPPRIADLIGSALLLCAIDGNPAARMTLDHLRRRFCGTHTFLCKQEGA